MEDKSKNIFKNLPPDLFWHFTGRLIASAIFFALFVLGIVSYPVIKWEFFALAVVCLVYASYNLYVIYQITNDKYVCICGICSEVNKKEANLNVGKYNLLSLTGSSDIHVEVEQNESTTTFIVPCPKIFDAKEGDVVHFYAATSNLNQKKEGLYYVLSPLKVINDNR